MNGSVSEIVGFPFGRSPNSPGYLESIYTSLIILKRIVSASVSLTSAVN
jgi:hypothetical protein